MSDQSDARKWFWNNADICGYEDVHDVYRRHVPIKFYGLLDEEILDVLQSIEIEREHERIELAALHVL